MGTGCRVSVFTQLALVLVDDPPCDGMWNPYIVMVVDDKMQVPLNGAATALNSESLGSGIDEERS